MMGNKDTSKVTYLDVSFQDEFGGRLVLKSRSMTFFSSSNDAKANVPWNAIVKIHTGATKDKIGLEEYTLKLVIQQEQSLFFRMQNEQDLDHIREDIHTLTQAYRSSGDRKLAPGGAEDSLTCFPRFSEHGSLLSGSAGQSVQSPASEVSTTSRYNKGPGQPNDIMEHGSLLSGYAGQSLQSRASSGSVKSPSSKKSSSKDTFRDEEISTTSHYNKGPGYQHNEIMVSKEGDDASTIASTANGSVRSFGDVEAASTGLKRSTRDNDDGLPVATYRLVGAQERQLSDTYMISKDASMAAREEKKTSKWVWLALCLLALLLIGLGIGIGILAGKEDQEEPTKVIAGLEDVAVATTTPPNVPSQSPTVEVEEGIAAALERTTAPTTTILAPTTLAPTFAPTGTSPPTTVMPTNPLGCSGVPHAQPINDRDTALDAGIFGGSSKCRATMFDRCETTPWVNFYTFQGTTSAWFTAMALEDSFCDADIAHQVTLKVPQGVDYDLHIYKNGSWEPTDTVPNDSSTAAGHEESILVHETDTAMDIKWFTYFIQVEYKSGSSCEPWTLEIDGHVCLFG